MALVPFPNRLGPLFWLASQQVVYSPTSATATIDATSESFSVIGRMRLTTGPGTSKVISSAGGKIHMMINSATWANVSTSVRVGIQDVTSGGVGDGTFDVFNDIVPGTDTITAGQVNTVAMTDGTKTIADGDLIAVQWDMTNRAGGDLIAALRYGSTQMIFPYSTSNGTRTNLGIPTTVEFDDGTLGFFDSDYYAFEPTSTLSIASNTTPDEVGSFFETPVPITIGALAAKLGNYAQTDDFEIIVYSDPLGTPTPEVTVTVDADQSLNQTVFEQWCDPFTFLANTLYVIAVRPTTTNALTLSTIEFSGIAGLSACTCFGTTARQASRSDQTGAFAEDDDIIPLVGFRAAAFDDGGSGGGEHSAVF